MILPAHRSLVPFYLLAGIFIASVAAAAITGHYLLAALPFGILFFYAGWQNRDSIFYLLLATLPFSIEYNFSPSLGTDIPDEFFMLLVSLLFLARWLYSPASVGKKMLQHPLSLLLLAGLSWMILTVCFSTHPSVSVKYLLAKSWYIGSFVLAPVMVFRDKPSIIKAGAILAGSMMLMVGVAVFRHGQTGFSFASVNEAVSPFFRNHVNYSAMLVCLLPLLIAFFRITKKRSARIALSAIILLALIALFFSYARGAWLALLAGVFAYWLLKKRLLLYTYIAAVILSIGLLFWIKANDRYLQYAHDYTTTIYHQDFATHFVSTYQLKDVSTAERFYRWIAGVRMIKDNWLTGYGPNTFYEHYKGYAVPAYKTWVSDNPEHSTVHNYFLLMAIEQGIPGLLFFLLLLGTMLYYAQRLYQRVTDLFYKTLSAVIGVMLTMIIVLNSLSDLIETDKIGSLFFLCFSLLIVIDINSRKVTSS